MITIAKAWERLDGPLFCGNREMCPCVGAVMWRFTSRLVAQINARCSAEDEEREP